MAKIISVLGSRVKTRLLALDRPQTWLAEQLDVSNEAVSSWIKGRSDPKFSNLLQMSKELECSVGYLAGDFSDASIAEVVRLMESASPEAREQALSGVIAVLSIAKAANALKKKAG